MQKLLILHEKGAITATLLLTLLDARIAPVLLAIDPAKDAAYRTAHAGQNVPRATYEAAVGLFADRLILTDTHGMQHLHPADTILLAVDDPNLLDILAQATTGKYRVINDAIVLDMAWQAPTFYVEPLPAKEKSQSQGKTAPTKAVVVKRKR